MKKRSAPDLFAKFFPHLPDDGGRCLFAHFDPAAGQGPVRIARSPVHEHVARMEDDGGGTNLKALAVKMD
ncbi:hypothetical protein GmRootV213_55140 (plasmid) [Variovorax sp. V213]